MTPAANISPLSAALRCRRPKCGQGRLFSGLLTVGDECAACGLDLKAQDAGDGPAIFVILLVAAVAAAFIVERLYAPLTSALKTPTWAMKIRISR